MVVKYGEEQWACCAKYGEEQWAWCLNYGEKQPKKNEYDRALAGF